MRHFFTIILFLIALKTGFSQGNARQPFPNDMLQVLRLYPHPSIPNRPIPMEQLLDSLEAVYLQMVRLENDLYSAYYQGTITYDDLMRVRKDSIPNRAWLADVVEGMKAGRSEYELYNADSKHYAYIGTEAEWLYLSFRCIEDRNWARLLDVQEHCSFIRSIEQFYRYRDLLLPHLPKDLPMDWEWWMKWNIVRNWSVNTSEKDDPRNLEQAKLLDELWTWAQRPDTKKRFSQPTLRYISTNVKGVRDTFYYSQTEPIYYQVLSTVHAGYADFAAHFESISTLKNTYYYEKAADFLKQTMVIEPAKSPYLRALWALQQTARYHQQQDSIGFLNDLEARIQFYQNTLSIGCDTLLRLYVDQYTYKNNLQRATYMPDPLRYHVFRDQYYRSLTACPEAREREWLHYVEQLPTIPSDSLFGRAFTELFNFYTPAHWTIARWDSLVRGYATRVRSPRVLQQLQDFFWNKAKSIAESQAYKRANPYYYNTIQNADADICYAWDVLRARLNADPSAFDESDVALYKSWLESPDMRCHRDSAIRDTSLRWRATAADLDFDYFNKKNLRNQHLDYWHYYQQNQLAKAKNESESDLLKRKVQHAQTMYQRLEDEASGTVYLDWLQRWKAQYQGNEIVGHVYQALIRLKLDSADWYDPDLPATAQYRWHKRQAIELYQEYLRLFPKADCSRYFDLYFNPETFEEECLFELTNKRIYLGAQYASTVAEDQPFPILAYLENVDKVLVQILTCKRDSTTNDYDLKTWVPDSSKRVRSLVIPSTNSGDFHEHRVELPMPALKAGVYRIELRACPACSPQTLYVRVSPYWTLAIKTPPRAWETDHRLSTKKLYVLDRSTGAPIRGERLRYFLADSVDLGMELLRHSPTTVEVPIEGEPLLLPMNARYLSVIRVNDTFPLDISWNEVLSLDSLAPLHLELFTDRAIYRSGQEVHWKVLAATYEDAQARAAEGSVSVRLLNPKGEEVARSGGWVRPPYGSTFERLQIPENAIGGMYTLEASMEGVIATRPLRIEAYKRPTFELRALPMQAAYRLGDTVCLSVEAKALAGFAVANAQLSYTLDAQIELPWGEMEMDIPLGYDDNGNLMGYSRASHFSVDVGVGKTDEQGLFDYCFVADRRSYHLPSMRYYYTVRLSATDAKGETQELTRSFSLSDQAHAISVALPDECDAQAMPDAAVFIKNADGQPVSTNWTIQIYRLKTPDTYKHYRLWEVPTDTVFSKKEWEKQLPHELHQREDLQKNWPTEALIWTTALAQQSSYRLDWAKLKLNEGVYSIDIETQDSLGNRTKHQQYFSVFNVKTPGLPAPQVLWTHCPQSDFVQGEKALLYLGSSVPDAHCLVYVAQFDSIIYHQWHVLNGKKRLEIPLGSALGELDYFVYLVQDNRIYTKTGVWKVREAQAEPLRVRVLDFPETAAPGSAQTLRIQVTDAKGKPVQGEITATLYDAALDQFVPHAFSIQSWDQLRQFPLLRKHPHGYYPWTMELGYELMTEYTQAFSVYDTIITFDPETFQEPIQTIANEKEGRSVADLNKPKPQPSPKQKTDDAPQLRTNLSELVFFNGYLETDAQGIAELPYELNDALTRWKLLVFVHDAEIRWGQTSAAVRTEKPLMIQPNVPRFVRQNDTIVLAALLVNQSDKMQKGKAELQLLDPQTKMPLPAFLLGETPIKAFKLPPRSSLAVQWRLVIPDTATSVLYRLTAKAGKLQDGEQNSLLVLSDKQQEMRTVRTTIRAGETRTLPLPQDSTPRSRPVQLRLNVSYNLGWDVLQSLPYLADNPYECSEQLTNRVYGNLLSLHLIAENPDWRSQLERWKQSGTPVPIGLSDPNQLATIRMETPWLLERGGGNAEQQRLARLLDSTNVQQESAAAFAKLTKRQTASGGLSWYGGDEADTYITLYVLQQFGHYERLTGRRLDKISGYTSLSANAWRYLHETFGASYRRWLQLVEMTNGSADRLDIRREHLYYLYAQSLQETNTADSLTLAGQAFLTQLLETQWQRFSEPMTLGYVALTLHQSGKADQAKMVLDTILRCSYSDAEGGRYFVKTGGYYWYQSPIETQALLIEAVATIYPDSSRLLESLKTWLLLQREGSRWPTSRATAMAATSLLLGGNWLTDNQLPAIRLNETPIIFTKEETERNPGKLSKTWTDAATLSQARGISIQNNNRYVPTYADATMYYLKPLADIRASGDSTFYLTKTYYKKENNGALTLLGDTAQLAKGDRVLVRLHLEVPKALEYVHLRDQHPSGFEPVSTESGYRYSPAHYRDVRDAVTNFFFNYLDAGTYELEYDLWVANSGHFQSGLATIECMYAPRFKAQTASRWWRVR